VRDDVTTKLVSNARSMPSSDDAHDQFAVGCSELEVIASNFVNRAPKFRVVR
jgi:hypothetical protein